MNTASELTTQEKHGDFYKQSCLMKMSATKLFGFKLQTCSKNVISTNQYFSC